MMKKYRTELNYQVEEWGNRFTPLSYYLINKYGGLGNLLTTDVNFKKAGALAGAVAPYVGAYLFTNSSSKDFFKEILCASTLITIFGVPMVTSFLGSKGGAKLDNLIEKSSFKPMCKYARRKENVDSWSVLKW